MTYTCETWTKTPRTFSWLESTNMAMLRGILGVSKKDHIRNEIIMTKTKAVKIESFYDRRK